VRREVSWLGETALLMGAARPSLESIRDPREVTRRPWRAPTTRLSSHFRANPYAEPSGGPHREKAQLPVVSAAMGYDLFATPSSKAMLSPAGSGARMNAESTSRTKPNRAARPAGCARELATNLRPGGVAPCETYDRLMVGADATFRSK